jgi:hypothetical protein
LRKAARVENKYVLTEALENVCLFRRNNKHVVSLENVKVLTSVAPLSEQVIVKTLFVSLEINTEFRLVTNNFWFRLINFLLYFH